MEQTINITIDPLGVPVIEAKGFANGACALATSSIEQALSSGGQNIVKEFKPEYYAPVTDEVQQFERNW